MERSDSTKNWTEKILHDTESVLIPNPTYRMEDFIFEKIEKKKPQRLSNIEYLGLDMIEAGGEFGQDGAYGQALIKTGQAEQKLGQVERDFISSAGMCFIQPLKVSFFNSFLTSFKSVFNILIFYFPEIP